MVIILVILALIPQLLVAVYFIVTVPAFVAVSEFAVIVATAPPVVLNILQVPPANVFEYVVGVFRQIGVLPVIGGSVVRGVSTIVLKVVKLLQPLAFVTV
jgi:hypothetical protein